ncbi:Hypothetical protein SMAX5B_001793 [Scophthalmus maximus]|uniref:Uncharacterized protein n=1 Tax=Scophthalmus maximus TaxID=52904 RepID=A0A2U9BRR9_SCOMX|nr:Hypothetical protein SMAX5B_001793 [Scophthalmus maximus]
MGKRCTSSTPPISRAILGSCPLAAGPKDGHAVPVVIHGEQVDVVDQYKYHGTLFDNTSSVCWFPSLIVKNRNNVHTGVPLHLNHWSAPS